MEAAMDEGKLYVLSTNKSGNLRPVPSLTDNKAFPTDIDYETVLEKLKEDFERKWNSDVPSPPIGLDDYVVMGTLGIGSFGNVKLVKSKINSYYYAAKIMNKDHLMRTNQSTHVKNEKRVMFAILFPSLTSLQFSTKNNEFLYLGMQYLQGGDLFTYHRKLRKFDENQARFYAAQVFLGLEYLHYLDFIYRDVKPENVLIDANGYIKITDFGFTKRVEKRTLTLCGTPEYLAPEIIQSKPYGVSVDWWAFGVFIYELVAGSSPFGLYSRDVMAMYAKICDGEYDMPHAFSPELKDLINNLLQVDQSKRYGNLLNGNKDIKNHNWFKTVNWYNLLNQETTPPFVPTLSGMEDLSHFDHFEDIQLLSKMSNHKYDDKIDMFADF